MPRLPANGDEGVGATRLRAADLPAPTANAGQLAPGSQLPRSLQRALSRELCEGEVVERVFLRSRESVARRRRRRLTLTAFISLCCLLSLPLGGWIWWLFSPLWVLGNLHLWRADAADAWVVTNQRCFRLQLGGLGTQVREVAEVPDDADLTSWDLHELRRCFAGLQKRLLWDKPGQRTDNARVARDLPRRLRDEVERRLAPGEALLWVDRPTPGDYFLYAPLDLWSIAGYLTAFPLATLALLSAAPVPLALAALGTGGLATARLWHQIRRTVYAVTDRRGLILVGGRGTQYDLTDMRRFQRSQNAAGRGTLSPPRGAVLGEGFFGVRNVKVVDDLIKQRLSRGIATEVTPVEAPAGRGDELTGLPEHG